MPFAVCLEVLTSAYSSTRRAPLYDNYYPAIVHTNCLLNAPGLFATVWSWLKHLFSKELQQTVIICTKGNTDLVSVLGPAMVPACYGGALQCIPADIMEQIGLTRALDERADDPRLADRLLPGPTSRLGRFHMPPDDAAALDPPAVSQRSSDRR